MTPYYQCERDNVTIYHGDALQILPQLPAASADLILTDPPYFRVKGDWWDRQWDTPRGFLDWLDALCVQWRRVLKPNGSVYVFASPDMAARVEVTIRRNFNVLNRIRWVKDEGWHNKADPEELRSYLSPWEEIIFAEPYEDAAQALHKQVFSPLGRYIQTERERAGLTRSEVEVGLGYVSSGDPTRGTALCYRWEEGSSLPTADTYERLRALLNERGKRPDDYLRREYEELRREYEELRREYEELRRPFALKDRLPKTDVWNFGTVQSHRGKHVCEKPIALLEHVISVSTKPDAVVLDCCMGSGSTLRAAKNLGRGSIGIEITEHWCRVARERIAQDVLDFGEGAAS